MRVVDDACDARIDAAQRGDQVADVHVVRPIIAREALMRRGHVSVNGAIGNDAPKLALPGMTVSVHKSRDDDRVRGVDRLSLWRRLEIAGHSGDLFALDQNIPLHKVADLRIHADYGATL